MGDVDYTDISMEQKGGLVGGRLKFTDGQLLFKPRVGKIITIERDDLDLVNWLRLAGSWGLRIFLTNGDLIRFIGFKDTDKEKVGKLFANRLEKTMLDLDVCVKGWNWGTAKFKSSALSYEIGNALGFDIPLNYVSQCTTGKNEVTLEFHQNDESRDISLMELRFHMASNENGGDGEPVEAFKEQVLEKANVIGPVGDAIAIFREIQCVTPRGRYDIKFYQSFFQLHGKTFDYKITTGAVQRLFLLPHIDGRQIYFVISLDPPIKQGQTRYHFLVFLFIVDEETEISLPFSEEEIQSKYNGKLEKDMKGPLFELMSRLMKVIVDRKITGPGKFVGSNSNVALLCSHKAASGFLYPLERGFMFVHKPPIHIRFEDVSFVNFVRSGQGTKSFDFEIELKSGVVHTFVGIPKEEYPRFFEFINNKGLHVNSNQEKISYRDKIDRSEPDAYLARVKAEAEDKSDEDDVADNSGSSEDEDFNPDAAKLSDVAEEFDSDAANSSDEADGSEEGESKSKSKKKKSGGGSKSKKEKEKTEKPEKKKRTKKEGTKESKSSGKSKGKKDSAEPSPTKDKIKSKEFISNSEDESSD